MVHSEREQFNSQTQYLLSVLGFAAGYGSIWRFPYLIYKNGGGVFLIPYFFILLVVGIPSFYFETSLGQMTRRSPPLCFQSLHKKWKGVGVFSILLSLNMSTYYNLILAYSLYYFFASFQSPLPWAPAPDSTSLLNLDYFYKTVLNSSSGLSELGGIVWPLFICYIISQIIVYICIRKGVTLSGKISLVTATSPFILLFILMLRGFFLSGAWQGICYLLSPDWSKLISAEVWVDAANQVIFQVSTGCGVLILLGSYRPKNKEILQSSYVIPVLTVLCGLLASFVIFTFMGHMAELMETSIDDLPLKGPDLAFIVFPAILQTMPFSNLLSIVFYLVMIFLGIDTQFAQVDAVAATIEDEMRNEGFRESSIKNVRAYVCIAISVSAFLFCSKAGFFYLEFVDDYSVGINLFACLFMQSIVFFFVERWENIEKQVVEFVKAPTPEYLVFLMQYSIPIFTLGLMILSAILQFKDIFTKTWYIAILGWGITLYPYYFVYYYYEKYRNHDTYEYDNKQIPLQLLEF